MTLTDTMIEKDKIKILFTGAGNPECIYESIDILKLVPNDDTTN